jgi:hypothetical protein
MDWLNAISVVALGIMTAIRIGSAAGALEEASLLAGAEVATGVAAGPQAAASMTINIPTISRLVRFIFLLLLKNIFDLQLVHNAGPIRPEAVRDGGDLRGVSAVFFTSLHVEWT